MCLRKERPATAGLQPLTMWNLAIGAAVAQWTTVGCSLVVGRSATSGCLLAVAQPVCTDRLPAYGPPSNLQMFLPFSVEFCL
jgi:hypothetical protein